MAASIHRTDGRALPPQSTKNVAAAESPDSLAALIARAAVQEIRRFALHESDMGIVARAALRTGEEGDMVACKRYSLPFFKIIARIGMKEPARPDGEHPLTRKELAEIKALAREIVPLA